MNLQLQGKKVAVTGAAGCFGKAFVKELLQHGATVYAISKTASKLQELANSYPSITPILCDLTNWNESEKTLTEMIPDDLDILINNSGIAVSETLEELTESGLDQLFNVNLKGTLLATKVISKKMIANGKGGCILNISSVASHVPCDFLLAYAMTKAGIDRLTKTLATFLGPHKIRVNSVNPTVIYDTKMGSTAFDTEAKQKFIQSATPLPYLPCTQDVSNMVLFLLSDNAKTLTGQCFLVDSGTHKG